MDDIVKKILEEHAHTFAALADGVMCPACKTVAYGQKFNLGEKFNWAEGHEACAETSCKDCGAKTKPGTGSARCPACWNDRFGD